MASNNIMMNVCPTKASSHPGIGIIGMFLAREQRFTLNDIIHDEKMERECLYPGFKSDKTSRVVCCITLYKAAHSRITTCNTL